MDESTYIALCRAHLPALHRMAMSITGSRPDAEDAGQIDPDSMLLDETLSDPAALAEALTPAPRWTASRTRLWRKRPGSSQISPAAP